MSSILHQLQTEHDTRQALDFLRDCTKTPPAPFATPLSNPAFGSSPVLTRPTFWTDLLTHALPLNTFSVDANAILFSPPSTFSPAAHAPLFSVINALRSREIGVFWGAYQEASWAVDVNEGGNGKVWIGRAEIDGGKHIGAVDAGGHADERVCRIGYGGTCQNVPAGEVELLCKAPWCALTVRFREARDGNVPDDAVGGGWEADQSELFIGIVRLRNGRKWVGKVRGGLGGCHIGLVKEEVVRVYQVMVLGSGLRKNGDAAEVRKLLGRKKEKDMTTHGFFDTFEELKGFELAGGRYEVATPRRLEGKESTVLLCHDMKGGYCPGADHEYRQVFCSWSKIHMFCYFAHHFVSIPPRVWIEDCAKNQVICLGTIATEHKCGEVNSDLLLHSGDAQMEMMCDKLAGLCVEFGFHGWLVNFESRVKNHRDVVKFLRLLTERCKEMVGKHARVVYYDSLDSHGRVHYQNALNVQNKAYFDACDAIFTNYWFGEDQVQSSLAVATQERAKDVFFGVDVFARGVQYGAGPGCGVMTRFLAFQGASVAVFAPGWSLECGPAKGKPLIEAQEADAAFWNTLFPEK